MIKRLYWQEEDPNLNLNLGKNKEEMRKKESNCLLEDLGKYSIELFQDG